VAFKEGAVFLLKGFCAVVFVLVRDVFAHGFDIRLGNGKRAVTGLPREGRELRALGFDPFGRGFFNILDDFADRDGSGEVEKQVGVVLDGIYENGMATEILQDSGHISMQSGADRVGDKAFAIFCAEDEVDVEPSEGLGHGVGRPFRAGIFLWDAVPGRRPGLAWVAPLAQGLCGWRRGYDINE
jgi:hypothetical protein